MIGNWGRAILQWNAEQVDLVYGLDILASWAYELYRVVSSCPVAVKRAGHYDPTLRRWVWDEPQKITGLGQELIEIVRAYGKPMTQGRIFRNIANNESHVKRELARLVRRGILTNDHGKGYSLGHSSES